MLALLTDTRSGGGLLWTEQMGHAGAGVGAVISNAKIFKMPVIAIFKELVQVLVVGNLIIPTDDVVT